MYAEKIVDENGDGNQGLGLCVAYYAIVLLTYPVQSFRRFKRGKRGEENFGMAVGVSGADVVLDIFSASSHRIVHVAAENLVELQDEILGNGDGIKIFVDDIQHIAIASNFLLITISGGGLVFYQLPDAGIGGHYPFNGVGGLCTLDFGNLNQLFQFLRPLLQVKLLLAGFLIYRSNITQDF